MGKLKRENRTKEINLAIVDVCEAVLREKVVVYVRNPIAVAGQIVIILQGVKKKDKGDLQKRWEELAKAYDRKIKHKHHNELIWLYSSRLLSGQTVSEVLISSGNPTLQALSGLREQVKRTWKGPYKVTLLPSTALSCLLRVSIDRGHVSYWSFRHFLLSPKCRYYLSIWGNILCAVLLQLAVQAKLPSVRSYAEQGYSAIEGHYMALDGYDIVILAAVGYSLTDSGFVLCRVIYCYLTGKHFSLSDLSLYISAFTTALALWFMSVSSWEGAKSGYSQLVMVGMSLAFWVIFISLGIVYCNPYSALRVTSLFGALTNSLVRVTSHSLPFIVLLFLFGYAYASHFMLENQLSSVWAKNIWHSLYYAFVTMLGNLELNVNLLENNFSSSIITVLFVLITNVIMLNFLVTLLSRIYKESREIGKREKTLLEAKYASQMRATLHYSWLNCLIPPFSLLAIVVLPLAIAVPKVKTWLSYWLVMAVYCLTLFPVGMLLNLACNCTLFLPCFLLSYPHSNKLQHFPGKVSPLRLDKVELFTSQPSCLLYLQWTLCGMPKLLKLLWMDLKYTAIDLLSSPEHWENVGNSDEANAETAVEIRQMDYIERMKEGIIGFEGELELILSLCQPETHSGSVNLASDAYMKQCALEIAIMRPLIVHKVLISLNRPHLPTRLSALKARLAHLRARS